MPIISTETRSHPPARATLGLQRVGAGLALVIASIYGSIYAGLLSVGRAEDGDLAILGVAGGLFVVIAGLLWQVRSRRLWAATAGLQILLAVMYVAVAPDRDPGFEVWGLTVRVLSIGLLVVMVALLRQTRRATPPVG